jgi:hypothetical protein
MYPLFTPLSSNLPDPRQPIPTITLGLCFLEPVTYYVPLSNLIDVKGSGVKYRRHILTPVADEKYYTD